MNPPSLPSNQNPSVSKDTVIWGRRIPAWLVKAVVRVVSLLSVAILLYILYSNWGLLRQYSWNLQVVPFLISLVIYVGMELLAALNWGSIVDQISHPIKKSIHFKAHMVSRIGLHLPGPVLHVPGRIYFYGNAAGKMLVTFASMFELLLIFISGGILAIGFGIQFGTSDAWVGILAIVLVGGIAIHPAFLQKVLKLLRIPSQTKIRFWSSVRWMLTCMLVWLAFGTSAFFMIQSIYPLSWEQLPGVIGAWVVSGLIATAAAFLPSSLGFRELTFSLLLSSFMPAGVATIAAILTKFLMLAFDLAIAGIAYKFIKQKPPE